MGVLKEHKNREAELEQELLKKQAEIEEKNSEIQKLRDHLLYLVRQKFGTKSERHAGAEQLSLFKIQELLLEETTSKESTKQVETQTKKKRIPKRTTVPAEFPRRIEIIEPKDLPEGAIKIGEEVTEKLEFTPGEYWVRRIVRNKYSIPSTGTIAIGELPRFAIDKGIAGSSLLAHLIVGKYCDHIPFYRMAGMLKRSGLKLPESTINNWFEKVTTLLEPLYDQLKKLTLSSRYVQADETIIRVLHDKPGSTHQGYFWVYHAPLLGALFFEYNGSRGKHVPKETLIDFKGVLQTDGYAGYEDLKHRSEITRLACMAHARRYFEKAKDENPDWANYVLSQIQRLYAIERHTELLLPEQRYAIRQKESQPILQEIKLWLDAHLHKTLPKSLIGKAINYALNHWDRLTAYTQDGTYLIDNNQIENKIRPVALGRKNYLFAGSESAAQRAAVMYSLFAACKVNDVDPYKWLKDVLDKIPDYNVSKISELLPAMWKNNMTSC